MAGCLKDKPYDDQEIQSNRPEGQPRVIEMKITANNNKNFLSLAYGNNNKDTVVDVVPIRLATAGVAPEDINVTVELRPALVQSYNDSNHTVFEVPNSSLISIVNPVVVIPKGSREGYLQVKFNPSSIIGHEYALGLAIAGVDKTGYTISGNMGTGVVAIATKNEFDGLYHSTGYFVHPTAPRAFDLEAQKVITFNATTITKALGDLGDRYPITVTVNPDNTVTIGEVPGSIAGVGNYADPARPAYNNTYDPATKTFMLSYAYPMPAPTRTITEKLVYTGTR